MRFGSLEEGIAKEKATRNCHVVDCDLEAFFDTVDHQKLMGRLRQRIADPELLALILKYLKAGAISLKGHYEETERGVPQGGPLSPLLGNILLDELDRELEKRGHRFVRYALGITLVRGAPVAETRGVSEQKSAEVIVPEQESGGQLRPV